jgi:hypothetical protein
VDHQDLDKATVRTLGFLASEPLPEGPLSKSQTKQIAQLAMDWLRNNDGITDELDEPFVVALANLAGIQYLKFCCPVMK